MPATVYYSTVGDRVVVRKVVLAQPAQPAAVINRGNDYYHYDDEAVAKLLFKLELQSARENLRGRFFCTSNAVATGLWPVEFGVQSQVQTAHRAVATSVQTKPSALRSARYSCKVVVSLSSAEIERLASRFPLAWFSRKFADA